MMDTILAYDGCRSQMAIYDSWMHLRMENTLQTVLSLLEVFEKLTIAPPDQTVWYPNFRMVQSSRNKMVAAIDLSYDDLETANPIGPKATVHKIGVFYFTIRNLPSYTTIFFNDKYTSFWTLHTLTISKSMESNQFCSRSRRISEC